MIALLTGQIFSSDASGCVIDVNGVGYLVSASTRTLAALPQHGGTCRLLIETVVREDAILLYGFTEAAERDWFRLLTTVQGVGAKVALGILSALAPRDLVAAIAGQDRGALTRAPGVGPKLAVRLVTELRDKVGGMPTGSGVSLPTAAAPAGGLAADAISALANLGYRRAEAAPVVERALAADPAITLDGLIRAGLRDLAR
jgi:Holliday junction DNA helicase RuvA